MKDDDSNLDALERQARVEKIAQAYAKGAYKVDPDAIASKMIDDALKPEAPPKAANG